MVPASPDYSAAGKVLAVLGAFGRGHEQLTLTQVARRAGLALSTTHRLVRELAEWGALERGEDGQWHIGLRLWEVASVSPRSQILRDVALPFMQDLYEATHENVQLAVREGTELVFVERIAGHHSVELLTMVGARFPLVATGMGRVLLLTRQRTSRRRCWRRPCSPSQPTRSLTPAPCALSLQRSSGSTT